MITYEVVIEVDQSIYDAYVKWLRDHVRELLQINGFTQASIWQDKDNSCLLTVRYLVRSYEDLQSYLHNHAQRLRKDAEIRFGTQIKIRRNIQKLLEEIVS